MRRIKENVIASGFFNDMIDYLLPYSGDQVRLLYTDEYNSGISCFLIGEFVLQHGSIFIRNSGGNFIRIDPVNEIRYMSDVGKYFLEIDVPFGSLTIDFL